MTVIYDLANNAQDIRHEVFAEETESSSMGKGTKLEMSLEKMQRSLLTRLSNADGLFNENELSEIEAQFEAGITAVQIVELFSERSIRFSEATFRKYVQQGLLPRSKRVGRKGKNRGSLGLYPAKAVRRVNTIKTKMSEGYTIEDIHELFLKHVDAIESVEENLNLFFQSVGADLEKANTTSSKTKKLLKDLEKAERQGSDLLVALKSLAQKVMSGAGETYRNQSVAGNAEDLL